MSIQYDWRTAVLTTRSVAVDARRDGPQLEQMSTLANAQGCVPAAAAPGRTNIGAALTSALQCALPAALLAPLLLVMSIGAPLQAQPALTRADSILVGRILLAEDARVGGDESLALGAAHADPRIRLLAVQARARIADPLFARRDSLSVPAAYAPPPTYPEPAWRLRLRALTAERDNCTVLRGALQDSAWPVRLRAADLTTDSCRADSTLVNTLVSWIDQLPLNASSRRAGGVSWHAAAHAIVALARTEPDEAGPRLPQLASHRQPELRAYVARAAAVLGDQATLATLRFDPDANVRALAIDGLKNVTDHESDAIYISALSDTMPQVVRSAARALVGSPLPDLADGLQPVFDLWARRGVATERDVRVALLAAMGQEASEDLPPPVRVGLPSRAVALALGATVRIRVTMSEASGGGSFVVRTRGDVAPMMAAIILDLVDARYYDGLRWHRVEHDFVVQGGSPDGNEYVGLPFFMRDALGSVSHARGTVGMSTRGHDTGDAQWFFNLRDNGRLDRDYTVWAEVESGIEVVDGILEGDRIATMRVVPE